MGWVSLGDIRILYIIPTRETFLQGKSNVCHKHWVAEATRLRQPPCFFAAAAETCAAPSPVSCPSTDSDSTHQHRPGSLHVLLAGCWPPHSSYQRDCEPFILTNEEQDRVNRFGTSLRLPHHKKCILHHTITSPIREVVIRQKLNSNVTSSWFPSFPKPRFFDLSATNEAILYCITLIIPNPLLLKWPGIL